MATPRLRVLIAAFFATAAIAVAQRAAEPPVDLEHLGSADALALAKDWLPHGNPQERAWAAYWIERDRLRQEVPHLLEALEKYQTTVEPRSASSSDDDSALLAVLDALIQLNADVPADSAEDLYAKFPAQALILLARAPEDAREPLLRILDKTQSPIDWLAAADLLATNPPAGFAARLLKGISIHASIQVLSPGQAAWGSGSGGGCGTSTVGGRGGWPPVGVYRLATQDSKGSELLAPGENPVYVKRSVERDYDASEGCGDMMLRLEQLRRDLIGQLLGFRKEDFALELNPSLDITWDSAPAYLDAVTAFVGKQEDILQDAQAGLEAQGLLTETEAASARLPFEVGILDLRESKTPLPDLVFADLSINITYRAVELDPAN